MPKAVNDKIQGVLNSMTFRSADERRRAESLLMLVASGAKLESLLAQAVRIQNRADIGSLYGNGANAGTLPSMDDGSDVDKPVGKAMLTETGHEHGEHTHPHASDYSTVHQHGHEHTHQDGTRHGHPHMHAHSHHDHYGDPSHSHPHTHVHDHSHEFRSAAPDLSKTVETRRQPTQAQRVQARRVAQPAQQQRAAMPSRESVEAAAHILAPFTRTLSDPNEQAAIATYLMQFCRFS